MTSTDPLAGIPASVTNPPPSPFTVPTAQQVTTPVVPPFSTPAPIVPAHIDLGQVTGVVTSATGLLESATNAAEPGYKTTEFWITVVTTLISVLVMFHIISVTADQTQAIVGMAGTIVPAIFYSISRGVRKSGTVA